MKKILCLILVTVSLFALVGCFNKEVIYDGEAELENEEIILDTLWAVYFNTDCLDESVEHIPLSNVTITLTFVDRDKNVLEIRVYYFPYIEPYQNYFLGYFHECDNCYDGYMRITAKPERGN